MDGVALGSGMNGKDPETSELYSLCLHQVIGDQLEQPLDELAPGSKRDFQLLGDGIGQFGLRASHDQDGSSARYRILRILSLKA